MTKRFFWRAAVTALVILCLAGCGEFTIGYVYVDNGGAEPITVIVDGETMVTIPPGGFKKLTLDLGARHFRITCGDSVVYDKTHVLDYGDRPYRGPKYVLNPDNLNRYCDVTVRYGNDRFEEERLDDLRLLAERVAECRESGNDPQKLARLEAELSLKVEDQFERISWDLAVFGDGEFFQFETPHNILTPVESVAWVKYADSTERSALIRVPEHVHDLVADALRPEQPTLQDLARLLEAERQALEFLPMRDRTGKIAQKN